MFTLDEVEDAARLIRPHVPPTPQLAWPLLKRRLGAEVWVKHENHTPAGAFKVRGGIVYVDGLARRGIRPKGLVSATRGNHGQSVARAGRAAGLAVKILVPHGNSPEKNAAMRAWGAEVVEHGRDFDEARVEAGRLAEAEGLHMVPAYHPDLVRGVATYALELFRGAGALDAVYVPIGMGSGISGMIAVRDLLGAKTEVIGVVAANAPAMSLSFKAGKPVPTSSARTFADGLACREPSAEAVAFIGRGAARIVEVGEDEIAQAVRVLFEDTHNGAEGAGAAALAAVVKERAVMAGKRVGVVLSGGNIDRAMMADVLAGGTPGA